VKPTGSAPKAFGPKNGESVSATPWSARSLFLGSAVGAANRSSRILAAVFLASLSLASCGQATPTLTNQKLHDSATAICSGSVLNVNYAPTNSVGQLARDRAAVLAYSDWMRVNSHEYREIQSLANKYGDVAATRSTVHHLDVILKTWKIYVAEISSTESTLRAMMSLSEFGESQNRIAALLKRAGQLLTNEVRTVWIPMGSLFRSC
jgi:hypothetical protein